MVFQKLVKQGLASAGSTLELLPYCAAMVRQALGPATACTRYGRYDITLPNQQVVAVCKHHAGRYATRRAIAVIETDTAYSLVETLAVSGHAGMDSP